MASAQQAAAAAARLATQAAAAQVLQQTAAHQQRQSHSAQNSHQDRSFPGKLTQIKEFPIERSQQPPYKLQKALIDQKIVSIQSFGIKLTLLLISFHHSDIRTILTSFLLV